MEEKEPENVYIIIEGLPKARMKFPYLNHRTITFLLKVKSERYL